MGISIAEDVDVIVLGGGLAGCAAALAAAEQGADVVLLEKQNDIGGSTVLSAGLAAFAGTDEQHELGIEDSVELLREDILAAGFHKNDPALVNLYRDNQLATYRWLKNHGVRYGHVHAAAGQTVPRSHPTDTRRMLELLTARAMQLGARVATGVSGHRLVREGARVSGVVVDTDEGRRTVHARAVVLATGGFSRNRQLLERFAPQMELAHQAGGAGNDGDGLRMARDLGADFADTPYIKGTYGVHATPHPHEHGTGILAIYKGAIAVNSRGERFVDESLPYKIVGDANLAQPGGTSVQVFDHRVMQASDSSVAIFDFAGRRESGLLVEAGTVEELAAKLDLPVEPTVRTVQQYNRRIEAGEPDPHGRLHLSGGVGRAFALVEPPFYGHPSGTVVLATYCGLTVDVAMRVRDVYGDPIDRLFAAGELVGGFHGGGYMTGTSIGKSAIFGRIAGRSAAENADRTEKETA